MKRFNFLRFRETGITLVVAIAMTMVYSSCEKDKEASPPELPPENAFLMNMLDFKSEKSTAQLTYHNFNVAVTSIAVWNAILKSTLAIPVVSYAEAFNHEPVKVSDDTWKWSYNVEVLSITYTAELYGKIAGPDVEWEMYITQEDGFQEFLWFEGVCDIGRTEGSWTVYENPINANEFLSIEWTRDWNTNTGDIRYTNIKPVVQGNGDYIYYGSTTGEDFNTFYNIYDSSEDKLVEILYNTESHAGRIFYQDEWHCWDENFQDINCEE